MGLKNAAESYARASREAVAEFGVLSAAGLLARAARSHARHGISPPDFFLNGLDRQPAEAWDDYLKMEPRFARMLRTVNIANGGSHFYRDKLTAELRCRALGLPIVRTVAVAGRSKAVSGPDLPPAFNDAASLAAFLTSSDAPSRLFIKPAGAFGGAGALAATRDANRWQVGDVQLTDHGLAERLLADASPTGTLLQARAASHPELSPVGGAFGLSSIRVNVALTSDGPHILVGAHKLLAYESLTDNLHSGMTGHLLARLDHGSGQLDDAFGKRRGNRYVFSRFAQHPKTGAPIGGRALSFAEDVFSLARQVSEAFSEAPLLALDIAATDDGVKLLEVNQFWNPYIVQLLSGRGILSHMREVLPHLAVDPAVRAEAFAILRGERTSN